MPAWLDLAAVAAATVLALAYLLHRRWRRRQPGCQSCGAAKAGKKSAPPRG